MQIQPLATSWTRSAAVSSQRQPVRQCCVTILSDSYIDTTNKLAKGQLQAVLGPQFVGEKSGREKSMLSLVHEELLYFFQQVMTAYVCFVTLEPSLTSGVSCADLVSSFRI